MSADRWAHIAESGSMVGLRLGGWCHRTLGRRACLALLWLPAVYFYLRNQHTRQGSRQYLERIWASPEGRAALGRPPGARLVLRHIHEFAVNLYDRMLMWSGALDNLQMHHDGSERIFELAQSGRGGLLLGAHLGSLDLLRFLSQRYDLRVNVVLYTGNARRVNTFFESISPDAGMRAIDIDPESVGAAFEIKACIERGEFVAILADRMAPGKTARTARVTFLGRPALFPLAPFLLGGLLGCPVLLALCVRTGDAAYETRLRTLRDGLRVPAPERQKRARELLERYAALLETTCQQHPFQWFNFYDFWQDTQEEVA